MRIQYIQYLFFKQFYRLKKYMNEAAERIAEIDENGNAISIEEKVQQ